MIWISALAALVACQPEPDDAGPGSGGADAGADDAGASDGGGDAGTTDPTGEPFEQDLLVNGGFETGGLDGWRLEGGGCTVVDGVDWLDPAEGSWMLSGGAMASEDCLIAQEVDLLGAGFTADSLDSGALLVEVESWLAASGLIQAWGDQSRLRLQFLDADGQLLGSLEPLIGTGSDWLGRAAEGLLPVGARSVRVEVEGRLRRGPDCDALADDIELRLRPVELASPGLTKLPMLQDHRVDAMRVIWETDGNLAPSSVHFGAKNAGLDRVADVVRSIEVDTGHFVHVVDLEGLQADTFYEYQVRTGDTVGQLWSFRTAPDPDAEVAIAWVADNQDGPDVFARHVRHMAAKAPDLLVAPGDVIEHADVASEWADYWWAPLSDSGFAQQTPVLIARGNHDAEHPYAYAYTALPGNEAWYSFRYGSVFIVVLDSEGPSSEMDLPTDQVRFIQEALASEEARTADFRIAAMHVAPYSNTNKDDGHDGDPRARSDWVSLFQDGGVDLVIGGHFHSYQRGELDGITYVVVGGGGAILDSGRIDSWDWLQVVDVAWHYSMMEVADGQLRWTTYDLFDQVIDTFMLSAD